MNVFRTITALIATAALLPQVGAQVQSCACGDGIAGQDFTITDGLIEILTGNGNDYQFFSEEPNGSPGDITDIVISANATGNFSITIDHNQVTDPTKPGARDLFTANLR